jgi:glutathione S-transferase
MYLAEQFPEQGLDIPKDSTLRSDYLRWMFFAPVTIEPSIVAKAMNYQSEEYQPFADIEVVAETLVAALAGRKYLVGESFSAADVVVGSAVNWGLNMMPVMPKRPELVTYWENLEQRPAWQVVRATMG